MKAVRASEREYPPLHPTLHDGETVAEDGAPGNGNSRFPSGMTTRKATATTGVLRFAQDDGVEQARAKAKQIPFGNDNQKSEGQRQLQVSPLRSR